MTTLLLWVLSPCPKHCRQGGLLFVWAFIGSKISLFDNKYGDIALLGIPTCTVGQLHTHWEDSFTESHLQHTDTSQKKIVAIFATLICMQNPLLMMRLLLFLPITNQMTCAPSPPWFTVALLGRQDQDEAEQRQKWLRIIVIYFLHGPRDNKLFVVRIKDNLTFDTLVLAEAYFLFFFSFYWSGG